LGVDRRLLGSGHGNHKHGDSQNQNLVREHGEIVSGECRSHRSDCRGETKDPNVRGYLQRALPLQSDLCNFLLGDFICRAMAAQQLRQIL